MTRFSWLRMTRGSIVWQSGLRGERTRYLERRIVFCADCESPRLWGFGLFQLRIRELDAPPSNLTTRVHQLTANQRPPLPRSGAWAGRRRRLSCLQKWHWYGPVEPAC
jgi:hypothetical protein